MHDSAQRELRKSWMNQKWCCDITCIHTGEGVLYLAAVMDLFSRSSDNAAMESFWGTLKTERVYHRKYETVEQARQSIFEYIECWYNRRRRHSAIGYKSPEQFEASLN